MFIVPDVDKIKKKLIEEFDFDAASSLAVVTTKDILLKKQSRSKLYLGLFHHWLFGHKVYIFTVNVNRSQSSVFSLLEF